MSVAHHTVAAEEAGQRLDRWFKRRFPQLGHGRLEKLLRTGQVRVDGKRAKASDRIETGQVLRIPPLPATPAVSAGPRPVSEADAAMLRAAVLHRDAEVIAINKPPGLPVQGGSGHERHLDGMLDALRFDAADKPRLVHRLDKDTSGVLVLARSRAAAQALTRAFRARDARKLYWALVSGVPHPPAGTIDLALAKLPGERGEMVAADEETGQRAITRYRVVEHFGRKAAFLAMSPVTGRTHQLRAHAAALGTPIVGDGKYGAGHPTLTGQVSRKLHLHARAIDIAHPAGGRLQVVAPLPDHMARSWALFGLPAEPKGDPFAAFD
ncbi:MAG: RluA family pseudouridine synthase [Alphaproteobacteria bacterium]|nr:RluA family pseudouridine synthase [Alphaproteobacteria bacterium]